MNKIDIDNLSFEPFIFYHQIENRIKQLAQEINANYSDKKPIFIGVLNGCFMFMSDLMKEIDIPAEMSFIKLSSYAGTHQGEVSELIGLGIDLADRDVVIVEDVVDSGKSLKHTMLALESKGAKSITVCTLLIKPEAMQFEFDNINYIGFEIQKEFVIGYGLDYNGYYRNLKDIYKEVSLQA